MGENLWCRQREDEVEGEIEGTTSILSSLWEAVFAKLPYQRDQAPFDLAHTPSIDQEVPLEAKTLCATG